MIQRIETEDHPITKEEWDKILEDPSPENFFLIQIMNRINRIIDWINEQEEME
ncbi:MAG: hypothetical protein H8D23_26555 [Candidatus Brocadiales bacterium]|nr:hypothetical protein [Candidatus Brocadiales bacterium]